MKAMNFDKENFYFLSIVCFHHMEDGNGNRYYYINDHLFTPQKMIDTSGNTVWDADWDSFGEVNLTVNTIENNLRFPGQYYDSETGFYYNFHRYYSPEVGRYLREDEVKNKWDFNLYVYVEDNPVMGIDNEGEDVLCINYVLSMNAGGPLGWFIRIRRLARLFNGVGLSIEMGTGVLSCTVCGRHRCYFYYFICAGPGLGVPHIGGENSISGTLNWEVGWWRGNSVSDFSGLALQVSLNFSIGMGSSVSWIGWFGGRGETSGTSSGLSAGGALTFCNTWGLQEVSCDIVPR